MQRCVLCSRGQRFESGQIRQARQNTVVSGRQTEHKHFLTFFSPSFFQHIISSLPVSITVTFWGQHRTVVWSLPFPTDKNSKLFHCQNYTILMQNAYTWDEEDIYVHKAEEMWKKTEGDFCWNTVPQASQAATGMQRKLTLGMVYQYRWIHLRLKQLKFWLWEWCWIGRWNVGMIQLMKPLLCDHIPSLICSYALTVKYEIIFPELSSE